MHLTALHESGLAGVVFQRRPQRLAAVKQIQARDGEVNASLLQIPQQSLHHRGVLGGALPQSQHGFTPVTADSQRDNHLLPAERFSVDDNRT